MFIASAEIQMSWICFSCKRRFLGGKKSIRVKFQCAEPCFGAMIKGNTIDEGQSEIPSLKLT